MKKTILNFFQKYRVCIKIDLLILIGFVVATICRNAVITGSNMVSFNLFDLYFIFGLPLLSAIYGSISYGSLKEVWVPQLILYLGVNVSFIITELIVDKEIDSIFAVLLLSVYPVIFSLIGTFIALLIKEGKEASEKIIQSSFAEPEEPIDVFTAKPSEILGKKKNASEEPEEPINVFTAKPSEILGKKKNASEEPEKTTPERDSSQDSETPPTQ